MKIPQGMNFQGLGYRLEAGDEIPEGLLAQLPDGHPLKRRAPRPTEKNRED